MIKCKGGSVTIYKNSLKHLWRKLFKQFFGIDLRSLALFRVGLALLIIIDLISRARDLSAHYTDLGVLPRWALLNQFLNEWYVSLHLISGKAIFQIALFVIAGMFALMLLMGYRTRLASIASWFFLVSLHSRNPTVLQAGDIYFGLLAFFAMFLPLGAVWSVDALRTAPSRKRKDFLIVSFATFALLFQVVIVYLATFFHKTGQEWFPDGTAIYYALSLDSFLTPFGSLIYQFPTLMQLLTYFVYFWFLIGPLLLIFSIGTVRTSVVLIFVLIHAGIGASLWLGLFPLITIVAVLAFLPSTFWDKRKANHIGFRQPIKQLENKIYETAARNRDNFIKTTKKKQSSGSPHYFWRILISTFLAFICIYILFWNIDEITEHDVDLIKYDQHYIGRVLHVHQHWDMFSPRPTNIDGWYIINATLKNGTNFDLFNNKQPVDWNKPKWAATTYKNQRWRKYLMNLRKEKNKGHRLYYGKYLCRDWNSQHSGSAQLEEFQIIFMQEKTKLNYEYTEPIKVVIWKHQCFKKE